MAFELPFLYTPPHAHRGAIVEPSKTPQETLKWKTGLGGEWLANACGKEDEREAVGLGCASLQREEEERGRRRGKKQECSVLAQICQLETLYSSPQRGKQSELPQLLLASRQVFGMQGGTKWERKKKPLGFELSAVI